MPFSSLDNTFIESLVDVGIVGTSILIAFVFITMRKPVTWALAKKGPISEDELYRLVAAGYMVILFIRSFTGSVFQVFTFGLILYLLLVVAWEFSVTRQPRSLAA